MRTESKQKLSLLVLSSVLAYAVFLLIAGVVYASIQGEASRIPGDAAVALVLALGVGLFGYRFLRHSGCRLLSDGMEVGRPFGSLQINYDSVSRVQRVTRTSGQRTEKVKVTFKHRGKERVMDITPESPGLLVTELVRRCPGLTASKTNRLKRDRTFRVAKESLESIPGSLDEGRVAGEPDW